MINVRVVETNADAFKDGTKYAIKIKDTLGTDLDGLVVVEETVDGPGIKLYNSFQEAMEVAVTFNEGAAEIIEYVYSND